MSLLNNKLLPLHHDQPSNNNLSNDQVFPHQEQMSRNLVKAIHLAPYH